jgi:hypothetical protein
MDTGHFFFRAVREKRTIIRRGGMGMGGGIMRACPPKCSNGPHIMLLNVFIYVVVLFCLGVFVFVFETFYFFLLVRY